METTPNIIDDDTDGATFTELTFSGEYRKWKKSNLMATFGTPAVGLGNVSKWQDRVSISRFNPLRSLRERASDTIDAAGHAGGRPEPRVGRSAGGIAGAPAQAEGGGQCAGWPAGVRGFQPGGAGDGVFRGDQSGGDGH